MTEAEKRLRNMLKWSDRLGSDERHEIEFDTADLEYGKGILSIESMEEAIKKYKELNNG